MQHHSVHRHNSRHVKQSSGLLRCSHTLLKLTYCRMTNNFIGSEYIERRCAFCFLNCGFNGIIEGVHSTGEGAQVEVF